MSGDERSQGTGAQLTSAEGILAGGEMEVLGLMPNASNYTFLARVGEGEDRVLAIYKPEAGETPLWDFPDGTLGSREVAAYEVARALGWPSVPPTVLRDGPHGPGSVQLFIDSDPEHHFFTLRDTRLDDFRSVALFDAVVNNADRKGGHCLLGTDGRIWSIDHGVCFHVEPKLRTVIWDFAEETVSQDLLSDLRMLAARLSASDLFARLSSLLAEMEVEALRERTDTLVASGRYPSPGSRRAVPWPPL